MSEPTDTNLPATIDGMHALQCILSDCPGDTVQEKVMALQSQLLQVEEQVTPEVIHSFGPGLYIREMHAPAGTLMIGAYQRFEHMNVLLKGRVVVVNDDGTLMRLEAPMVYTGKPGKKCGIVERDLVWQNIYATTETDIDNLEQWIVEDYDTLQLAKKLKQIRADYHLFIEDLGLTEEEVQEEVQRTDNVLRATDDVGLLDIRESVIHGKGLFAACDIPVGTMLGYGTHGMSRTMLGRHVNHSPEPNAEAVVRAGEIAYVALEFIPANTEVTISYRSALPVAIHRQRLLAA